MSDQSETKLRWEPVLDKHGRRIPKRLRYIPTGEIYVRETFKKEKIPPLFESTGETTIGRANTAAKIMVQRHRNEHLGIKDDHVYGRAVAHPLRSVIDWTLEHYTPTLRRTTQRKHQDYFAELDHWLGHYDVNAITRELFAPKVEKRRGKPKRVRNRDGSIREVVRTTFGEYAKHMNVLMRIAYEELKVATHLITFDDPDKKKPVLQLTAGGADVDDGEEPDATWRVYTPAEIARMWAVMRDVTRDQFVLCYECFMRKREALHLELNRIDLETGKITLRPQDVKTGSKTGKGREFIMSPRALARVRARVAKLPPGSRYLFPSLRARGKPLDENKTAWRGVKSRAGISGTAKWHHLRHTALTRALLDEGRDPVKVSEYAGVSLQTIQRVYLHSSAEQTKAVASAIRIQPLIALPPAEKSGCEQGVNGSSDTETSQ